MNVTQMNIRGQLFDLTHPRVMGIINCTPDSFYTSCSTLSRQEIVQLATRHLAEGADILDIGGCSTRPGAEPVSESEESKRVCQAIRWIREEQPTAVLSVDTFRPEVARDAVQAGADIINDVSGGHDDMYDVVAELQIPYILTHACAMTDLADLTDHLQRRLDHLVERGVKDVIVDPGFGFGKTLEQNYQVLRQLNLLQILERPLLVGLSHKSMLYKLLGGTAADMGNATTVANTLALTGGASILRTHEVKPAVEAIRIYEFFRN